jgi:hypothetical protein
MKSSRRDKTIRFLYGLLFFILWLTAVYYIFGFTTSIYRSGSVTPNGERVYPYNQHGKVVYVTEIQYILKDLCGVGVGILFCLYIMIGAVLQGVYKIEIFNTSVPWLKSSDPEKAPPQSAKKN